MVNIRKLNEETWAIEEESVRFFLLIGTNKAILIDSGHFCRNAREIVEQITDLPISVLNTHADPDHIACNHQFDTVMMNPSEFANLYSKCDEPQLMNLVTIYPESALDLGNRVIELIPLPGHTPGSVAILDTKYRVLFGGDSIQTGNIFMFGPMRNMKAYEMSLVDLLKRNLGFDFVYPSHGELPVLPEVISTLISDAQKIMNIELPFKLQSVHGNLIRAYQGHAAVFYCDHDK